MNTEREISYEIVVLRTFKGYLEKVWEEGDDECVNCSFTNDPLLAYKIYDYGNVPKYLWNDKTDKPVKTIAEMCEVLNGELVKYEVHTTTVLKEVKDET